MTLYIRYLAASECTSKSENPMCTKCQGDVGAELVDGKCLSKSDTKWCRLCHLPYEVVRLFEC